jgi:hypothetical protein
MKRLVSPALALLLAVGCATESGSSSHRGALRNVLIGLAAGTTALAVGAAVRSRSIENDLRRDVQAGKVTGHDYFERDASGTRWNRIARASTFGAGAFVLGLGVVWEMGRGDEIQTGPREPTPADDPRPIFPVPPVLPPAGR